MMIMTMSLLSSSATIIRMNMHEIAVEDDDDDDEYYDEYGKIESICHLVREGGVSLSVVIAHNNSRTNL